MQAEFQCSYSLQLPLGNQQQILTAHFHVYSFAFPLGRALVLLQRACTRGEKGDCKSPIGALAQSVERAGGSPGSPSSAGESGTGWWYRPAGGQGSNSLKTL